MPLADWVSTDPLPATSQIYLPGQAIPSLARFSLGPLALTFDDLSAVLSRILEAGGVVISLPAELWSSSRAAVAKGVGESSKVSVWLGCGGFQSLDGFFHDKIRNCGTPSKWPEKTIHASDPSEVAGGAVNPTRATNSRVGCMLRIKQDFGCNSSYSVAANPVLHTYGTFAVP